VRTAAFNGGYVLGANDPTLSDAQMLTLAKRRDVPEKRFALLKGPLAVRHVSLHKQARLLSLIFRFGRLSSRQRCSFRGRGAGTSCAKQLAGVAPVR